LKVKAEFNIRASRWNAGEGKSTGRNARPIRAHARLERPPELEPGVRLENAGTPVRMLHEAAPDLVMRVADAVRLDVARCEKQARILDAPAGENEAPGAKLRAMAAERSRARGRSRADASAAACTRTTVA
jgi:hypothetical protein